MKSTPTFVKKQKQPWSCSTWRLRAATHSSWRTRERGDQGAIEIGGNSRHNDDGHAWNAVPINGEWRLLDVSSMASGAGSSPQGRDRPIDFSFLTRPERLIFRHFPRDPKWQLLSTPLSRRDFDEVPAVLAPSNKEGRVCFWIEFW